MTQVTMMPWQLWDGNFKEVERCKSWNKKGRSKKKISLTYIVINKQLFTFDELERDQSFHVTSLWKVPKVEKMQIQFLFSLINNFSQRTTNERQSENKLLLDKVNKV